MPAPGQSRISASHRTIPIDVDVIIEPLELLGDLFPSPVRARSPYLVSFDGPVFAATAPNVDGKFAEMLGALGVPVPSELLPAS